MRDATDIYLDNFIEGLKQLHRYLIFGFGSSLFFLVLVKSRGLIEAGKGVSLPGLLPADPMLAGWIVWAASFTSACLANLAFLDVERILAQIREKREVLLAILTYPSIATSWNSSGRRGLTLVPPLMFLFSLPEWLAGFGLRSRYRILIIGVSCLPYLLLALHLRKPIGYHELKWLAEQEGRRGQ